MGHKTLKDIYDGQPMVDPGSGGTITVNRSPAVVPLVSGGAEARTLARPTRPGAIVTIYMHTDGGDITLTVTGGFNEDGETTFTFSDPGQFITLQAIYASSAYVWRKISDHTVGNLSATVLAILDAITASAAELNILDGVTATTDEINNAVGDGDEVVITTNVIGASENGKTFYLDLAAGFTSTLPAPAIGLRFRFIVKTAPTGAPYVITTNGGDNVLYGMMVERAGGAGVAGAAQDTFNFIHTQSIIADWVEFYSDGTNWYYHGMVDVAAGNTVSAT